jgi:hypothetical protein
MPFVPALKSGAFWHKYVKRRLVGHSREDKMKKRLRIMIGENYEKVKYFKGLQGKWVVRELPILPCGIPQSNHATRSLEVNG